MSFEMARTKVVADRDLPAWLFGAVSIAYFASFAVGWFLPTSLVGIGDWDWVFSDAWVSCRALVERGWPGWWSIQLAGGTPLVGNPESLAASPFLALPLLFGPIVGIKLLVVLLVVVGFAACLWLGMRWIGDPLGAATFAFLFVFSGHFAIHFRAGHFPWAMFYLVPAILLCVDALLFDEISRRGASIGLVVGAALLLTGTVYHPLVFFLGPLALAYALVRRDVPRARVVYVLLLGLSAVLIAMPRFAAVLEWQAKSPREVAGHGGISIVELARMLLVPIDDYKAYFPHGSGIWEYWSYVGTVGVALAALSLAERRLSRVIAIATTAVGVALAWRTPWGGVLDWLSALPLVGSIRVASRFLGLVVFGLALGAGGAIAGLRAKVSPRFRWVPLFLALAIVGEHWLVVRPIWTRVFEVPLSEAYPDWQSATSDREYSVVRSAPPFQPFTPAGDMYNSRMLPILMAGDVVPNAYTALTLHHLRLPDGPLVHGGPPDLRYRIGNQWIDLDGDLRPGEDVTVAVRSPHHAWKVDDRSCARPQNDEGEMRVVMLKRCGHVHLSMHSSWELVGWIVAAIGLALGVWLIRRGPNVDSKLGRGYDASFRG